MKITRLVIKNFRSLSDVAIDGFDSMNLFFGINGSGKTSVIDAIKILLSWYVARLKNTRGKGIPIKDSDITIGSDFCELEIEIDNNVKWKLVKYRKGYRGEMNQLTRLSLMNQYINSYMTDFDCSKNIDLIDAYGVNRAVLNMPQRIRRNNQTKQLDALKVEMSNSVNFHDFFVWFREMEDYENERLRETRKFEECRELQAVRKAMQLLLPEYGDLKVKRNPRSFVIKKNDKEFNFNQLSDGEKSYICLVCDIARKLSMTNPSKANALEGIGVIIIDELDLHLHPSWQKDVVQKLRTIFPNCQFFISSHSPIISTNIDGSVYSLENGQLSQTPIVRGLDYGTMLRDFMQTPDRDVKLHFLVDQYVTYKKFKKEESAQKVMVKIKSIATDESSPIYSDIRRRLND